MTAGSTGRLLPGQWKLAHASLTGHVGLAIAVTILIGTAHAQTVAGTVRGVIADPAAARVWPGTTIALTRQETGMAKERDQRRARRVHDYRRPAW